MTERLEGGLDPGDVGAVQFFRADVLEGAHSLNQVVGGIVGIVRLMVSSTEPDNFQMQIAEDRLRILSMGAEDVERARF